MRVTSSKVEHQRRLSASLHAELNGLTAGGSFQASLATANNDASSHTEVSIQVHQTGGVGDQIQIPGTEADRIREHMNRFASAAHANAAAYKAELVTYDTLALPFPPPDELEDRRRVLEDCLQRRQTYWSAISDLTFAQAEDAELIFENLPSPDELLNLQNTFRRILNDLMAHARKVSSGAIEPVFFVAEGEPPRPRFKRRAASRFATWWAQRHDPSMFRDEVFMINRIADQTVGLLTVPPEQATPEAMERAADSITSLDLSFGSEPNTLPLSSIAKLPDMIDAPLRELTAEGTHLEDIVGLESFSRLESVNLNHSRVRDISPIASAAGLGDFWLVANAIVDLSPIRALTRLAVLSIAGNRITSLEPLRDLDGLFFLSIARSQTLPDGALTFIENPISDARALDSLPKLANPFTSANELNVSAFEGTELITTGFAKRIGDTHRFQFSPDNDAFLQSQELVLMALWEHTDLNLAPAPIVLTGAHLRKQGFHCIAGTPSDNRSGRIPAAELKRILFEEPFAARGGPLEEFFRRALGRHPPADLILEVTPI